MCGRGTSSDIYETGTRSAIAGGCTTIVAFPPQRKHEPSLLKALGATHTRARGNSYCDYGLDLLVGNPGKQALPEFKTLREKEGVTSLKIYMTYTALQLRDDEVLSVLLKARENRILSIVYAGNGDVNWLTDQLESKKFYGPKYHSNSRPPVLEAEATSGLLLFRTSSPTRPSSWSMSATRVPPSAFGKHRQMASPCLRKPAHNICF